MNKLDCGKQIALGTLLDVSASEVPSQLQRGNMVPHWNWLRLLNYCLVRVFGISLLIAIVLVGGALAFAHGQSVKPPRHNNIRNEDSAAYRPITGVITDSDCGARHNKDGRMSAMECVRFCVRNGSKYILVDGDKRYNLTGNTRDLSKLAGQRVTISGSRNGDSIQVDSALAQ